MTDPHRDTAHRVRRVNRTDWDWIASWYRDPELDRRLGPMDESWLEHVLADDSGAQLVVEDDTGTPVALVGCVWDPSGAGHVISDLAVAPALRGRGVGRHALAVAQHWQGHPETRCWTAFVDDDNGGAFAFFSAIDWTYTSVDDGMHRFRTDARWPGSAAPVTAAP